MPTQRFGGKRVLVTGAASGIGRETAFAFAREGADLVICDVDAKGLAATEKDAAKLGAHVTSRRVDVSKREEMRAFSEAVPGEIDILVNNAGVGLAATFLDTSLDDWEWILSINLLGVIHGCHFFLPRMVAATARPLRGPGRRKGHVVNVSSVAGFFGTSLLAAYSTTKFGVFGLSEALREELAPQGIGVTTICPGIIDTPIVTSTRTRGKMDTGEARARTARLYKKRGYGPEKVAAAILKAVAGNHDVVPVAPEAWALYAAKRVAPSVASRIFSRISAKATGV